jgi:hypothetical protein
VAQAITVEATNQKDVDIVGGHNFATISAGPRSGGLQTKLWKDW